MAEKLTTKQKLDSILGIDSGKSIDEFLNGISDDPDSATAAMNAMAEVKDECAKEFDEQAAKIDNSSSSEVIELAMKDMTSSLKKIEDVAEISEQMFKHVYENVISSDLLDSELIGAAAKLLEAIHINHTELVQTYREKQRFIDKVKIMMLQQEQKKELMRIRHEYELENLKLRSKPDVIDGQVQYGCSQEQIVKMIEEGNKNSTMFDDSDIKTFESDIPNELH